MTAIARTRSGASVSQLEVDMFKVTAMFCGAGLVASSPLAMGGLDRSSGFFFST